MLDYNYIHPTKLNGIELTSCSIKDLFLATHLPILGTDISGQLAIPEYQRPYVWSDKQVLKLILDLEEHGFRNNEESPDYYLGSLILHREGEKLNIIDGQQRITTLMILQLFQKDVLLSNIVYSSPLSTHRISENIKMLKVKKQSEALMIPHIALDQINVTLIVTDNEDLAYTFFETQNTGGKRLSGADIIKSHHLRVIKPNVLMGQQALKWESHQMRTISHVINLLTKIRFWNFLELRDFPSYRSHFQIKNIIVEEFTERTLNQKVDRSLFTVEVSNDGYKKQMSFVSGLREIRQPLSDGKNFMDYLEEYTVLYEGLFGKHRDNIVDPRFYDFREKIITGENGTTFLKEMFELATLSFVSRFGKTELYAFSLWCFRYIYAMRVENDRNVREDGVMSFAKKRHLIDYILQAYSVHAVVSFLKKREYELSEVNCEERHVKGKYIMMLGRYFNYHFSVNEVDNKKFDERLKEEIICKLENSAPGSSM